MGSQKHIIKKQIIELNVPIKESAFLIQENIRVLYYDKIIKILDDIFSEICAENEYRFFEKIEINIGRIKLTDFDKEFFDKLKLQFYELLIEQIKEDKSEKTTKLISPDGKVIRTPFITRKQKEEFKQSLTKMEYHTKLIKHFILTGVLPWWADVDDSDINKILLVTLNTENEEISEFVGSVITSETVQKRLIYQFDVSTVKILLTKLFSQNVAKVYEWEKQIIILLDYVPELHVHLHKIKGEIQSIRINTLIELSAEDKPSGFYLEHIFEILQSFGIKAIAAIVEKMLETVYHQRVAEIKTKSEIFKSLEKYKETVSLKFTPRKVEIIKPGGKRITLPKKHEKIQEAEDVYLLREKDIIEPKRRIINEWKEDKLIQDVLAEEEKTDVDQLFVSNSGLVLLAPYLMKFFNKLNFIDGDKFINKENQFEAVHVLQFLVTEQEKSPEQMLALNKILCGLDVAFPVPITFKITEEIIFECNNLLRSVIDNWKNLGSTSINGFRESFLRRGGIIEIGQINILLRVENRPYDMLLNSIPWSYTVIKYPWMKKSLYVEWR